MRVRLTLAVVGLLLVPSLVTAQTLDWSLPAAEALEAAETAGKPLLVWWVAGTTAPAFAQELDRLFAQWPSWTQQLARQVVPLRLRSWEGPWPGNLPALPTGLKSSLVGLVRVGDVALAASWTEVPPVLEFSHSAVQAGLQLDEPYSIDVTEFDLPELDTALAQRKFVRSGPGPFWTETNDAGTKIWKEDGLLGALLVLKDTSSAVKVAFPLENDWSFLFNPVNQSWTPWSPVLVKHR